MRSALSLSSVLFACLFALGCGKGADEGKPTASSATTAAAATSAAPTASASAAGAASAAPGKTGGAASYQGDFESKAAALYLPDRKEFQGVKRVDFESKTALGAGKIQVNVDAAGVVSGTVSGALGDLTIAGRSEEGRLTATVAPAKGTEGFYGTLVAEPKGDTLEGTLAVSGERSSVLREADLKLAKAK